MTFYDFNDALKRITGGVACVAAEESVGLFELSGRVLAQPVRAVRPLPPFDNSAMDGYAVRCEDGGKTLRIGDTIFAGDVPERPLEAGEVMKVMTGAPVPPGCEAVVPFEAATPQGDGVQLPEAIKPGNHIKRAGEELSASQQLFKAGEMLDASRVALLASQGIMAAPVYRPLRVAVLSGGDEVTEPWQKPGAYQIYNTNSIALVSALKAAGYEAVYATLSGDDEDSLSRKLERVLAGCDAVLTTGGISVGEADFTRAAFERLGIEIFFHGLNLKPGRPTMAGRIGQKLAVALPGNPLSALVNFHLLVLPALAKMQGRGAIYPDVIPALNQQQFSVKPGRDMALLGRLERGLFTVTRGGQYGSGMLLPLAESNALALFESTIGEIGEGASIRVLSLGGEPVKDWFDPMNRT